MIYDPWPLVDGIKDETTLQKATQQAISLLKGRAVEVGKLNLWEGNFWGRKKRKAPEPCKEGGPAALAQAHFDPVQTSSCPQYDVAPY